MATNPQRYFWIILLALLTGCKIAPAQPIATATTTTPPTALPTFTALPPDTAFSTLRPLSTTIPTRTLLPASLPKFPLDGYVILFTRGGDLYFQDGENTPVKLTHIGEKAPSPILSDDNKKVVFSRSNGNTYSINTDGTQEQIVIPINWSDSLEAGTFMGVLSFVPETHLLFFEAMLCKEESSVSLCSAMIFLADTDTGEIRKLADLGLALQNHFPSIQKNVRFSPDGTMMAVGTMEGVKIFTLDGKITHQNILSFTPSTSDVPFPSLFWLPNSNGLIVAIPDKIHPDPFFVGGAPAYTIWRYTLDDNTIVQIPFDPPIAGTLEVSPDGNWIVYGGISPTATELYLGNLSDGNAKTFGNDLMRNFHWSSDSKHFIYGNAVVISFDKPPVFGGGSTHWVDSNHYIHIDTPETNPSIQQRRVLIAEIEGDEVFYYELGFSYLTFLSIKEK